MNKKRLDLWKALAGFLGRSLRTVQRWHECNGLSVHYYGGRSGSVFADEAEISHWLASLAKKPRKVQVGADEALETCKRRSHELTVTANGMWKARSEKTIAGLCRKAIGHGSRNAAASSGLANSIIFCALNDMMDGSMA